MLPNRLVVTVAQAEGSEGREIAMQLASRLQMNYLDDAVLRLATENLTRLEVEAYLRDLAQRGHLLIVGCGANFVLGSSPWVINLLIIAPLQTRIEKVMQKYQLKRAFALRRLYELDEQYATRTRQAYGLDWTSPELYDLTLNTQNLSVSSAVIALSQFIQTLDYTAEPPQTDQDLEQRYHKVIDLLYH